MSFWTGTHWERDDPAPPTPARLSRRRHVAEALAEGAMIALLAAGLIAGTTLAAKGGNSGGSPTLDVSTVSAARTVSGSAGSLTVEGRNFTPSSGGQMVVLWIGYPDDYCAPDYSVCHGFYAYPTVKDDGTFSVTYDNVLMQSGTGVVNARQYSVQTNKWRTVDKVTYTVP